MKSISRRKFLGQLGTASVVAGAITTVKPTAAMALGKPQSKYYNAPTLDGITVSKKMNLKRSDLTDFILDRIPAEDRAEQILNTVVTHIEAEEKNDVEATMKTMIANPVFEDIPAGVVLQGHQSIAKDYLERFASFPSMKRHITNAMVDKNGCFMELLWEGYQKGSKRGVKPTKNPPKFVLPVSVYFEVNEMGLITRETAYYDQYLGMLSLELIPDILNNKALLLMLNPGLALRLDKSKS